MRESEDTGLPVFVINLDAEKERLIVMDKALSSLGIAWERMAGVDGNALSPEELSERNRRTRLRKLSSGEMGCLESHVRIWQRIAEGTKPAALVLEDDVVMAPDVALLVKDAGWLPSKDCIVRLEAWPMRAVLGPLEKKVYNRGLYRLRSYLYGSGAYIVTQARARTLLAAYRSYVDAADAFMFRYAKANQTFQLVPGLCLQKQWQRKESSASTGHATNKMEEQRRLADRRSWIDPSAVIRRLAWKLGSVSAIAWDVIRGYRYQAPLFETTATIRENGDVN